MGQNHENIKREIFARRRIAIWGLRSARIKNMKKTDPHFFQKKMWVCFLQLFDPSTPKASNRDPTTRAYFTRNFFQNLSPFKSKYLTTFTEAIILWGFLTILVWKSWRLTLERLLILLTFFNYLVYCFFLLDV